jgi:hypothetical protein
MVTRRFGLSKRSLLPHRADVERRRYMLRDDLTSGRAMHKMPVVNTVDEECLFEFTYSDTYIDNGPRDEGRRQVGVSAAFI